MDTRPLTNLDLIRVLQVPVVPAECVVGYVYERPTILVCNTNPSWEKKGGHWLAICLESDYRGFFFDSFGRHPSLFGFEQFMNDNCAEWEYNDLPLQSVWSSVCGHHVVAFVKSVMHGMSYAEHVSIFTDNLALNDRIVVEYYLMTTNEV